MEGNFEYRLQQLESERLPRRVAELEFISARIEGEVTALKEIARSIGVKVDSGIERLTTNSAIEINKLQIEQAKAMSFIRGVTWVFASAVGFIGLAVMLAPVIKKLMSS